MPTTTVKDEDFVEAKGDPKKIQELADVVDQESESKSSTTDLRPPQAFTIAGLPCRPWSSGVLGIMEEIDHPLYTGDELKKVNDINVLIFILTHPDEGELVDMAEAGTLKTAAKKWAFALDPEVFEQAMDDADKWMAEVAQVSGPASPEDEIADGKKKDG